MSRHKKKNRNNQSKEEIREQQKTVNEGSAGDNAEDYTQELTFDLSDFDEAEPFSIVSNSFRRK